MTCVSCGATIADKAIVCYRCGTPTANPASARPDRPAPRRAASPLAALVLILLGLILAAFSLMSDAVASWLPSGRTLGTILGVLVAAAGGWLFARRR
jgi:hypothetical protein